MADKTQIENPNMKRRLLNVDNIPILEALLDREAQRLERLQKCKENDKLNLGNNVSPDELTELFPQICTEVDRFLEVDGDVPKFGYYNLLRLELGSTSILSLYTLASLQVAGAATLMVADQNPEIDPLVFAGMGAILFVQAALLHSSNKDSSYTPVSKTIILERSPRTVLIPTASHEYTHYLQHREGLIKQRFKYSIFSEGHARGVQKHVSEEYMEREDNEAFLYDVLDSTVGEFKSAYVWMCKKLGQQPKESLLKTKTTRDADESVNRLVWRCPTPHAIGNALFSIYEARQGRQVYNHMIHGNFQFS